MRCPSMSFDVCLGEADKECNKIKRIAIKVFNKKHSDINLHEEVTQAYEDSVLIMEWMKKTNNIFDTIRGVHMIRDLYKQIRHVN